MYHCTGDAEAVPGGRGVETWRAQAALRPVQRLEGDGWAERRGRGLVLRTQPHNTFHIGG